jgi:rhodanese-related sulfurtransferase
MVGTQGFESRAAVLLAVWLPLAPLSASHLNPAINQGQLMERLTTEQAPPLIDVRTPGEFQAGHVPGAINIPLQEFQQRVGELSAYRDKEVVLYCETGMRASHGGRWLESRGFEELRFLDGHMRAWREAGLPTER